MYKQIHFQKCEKEQVYYHGINIINLVHTVNPEEIRALWAFEGGLCGGGGGIVVGGGCFKNASRNW